MELVIMSKLERLDMMRRRQAYFAALAEEYDTFDDFIKSQEMWLAIMGIQLTRSGEYIELYIQLDFTEYEQYYIIKTQEGPLTVSDIILWQDEYCCNSRLDISTGNRANEKDISGNY